MGPAEPHEFRQKLGPRSGGASEAGIRNSRIDLDPAEACQEHPMRTRCGEPLQDRVTGRQDRTAGCGPEAVDQGGVGDTHAGVGRAEAEPEVEQGCRAVLGPRRPGIRAQFREHGAAAHRAGRGGQAEGDGLAPAPGETRLVGERQRSGVAVRAMAPRAVAQPSRPSSRERAGSPGSRSKTAPAP